MLLKGVPYYRQRRDYTCGPACLKMVLKYLGVEASRTVLTMMAQSDLDVGTNYMGMINAVLAHYRRCYVKKKASIDDVRYFIEINLPVIINWFVHSEKVGHFSVVIGISDKYLTINDPYIGPNKRISIKRFKRVWHDSTRKNWNWMMAVLPRRIHVRTEGGRVYKKLIETGEGRKRILPVLPDDGDKVY